SCHARCSYVCAADGTPCCRSRACFLSLPRHPPTSTLFPYTTLFRSVRILSPRWAANTPNTMVSELDSRQAVMMVALMMLSLPKRSEEHTSELQSRFDLVCRLLLEKKKKKFEVH